MTNMATSVMAAPISKIGRAGLSPPWSEATIRAPVRRDNSPETPCRDVFRNGEAHTVRAQIAGAARNATIATGMLSIANGRCSSTAPSNTTRNVRNWAKAAAKFATDTTGKCGKLFRKHPTSREFTVVDVAYRGLLQMAIQALGLATGLGRHP